MSLTHEKSAVVTYRGHRVEITAAHELYDVQEIDQNGRVVLDANSQPKWTGNVPVDELTAEKPTAQPEPVK